MKPTVFTKGSKDTHLSYPCVYHLSFSKSWRLKEFEVLDITSSRHCGIYKPKHCSGYKIVRTFINELEPTYATNYDYELEIYEDNTPVPYNKRKIEPWMLETETITFSTIPIPKLVLQLASPVFHKLLTSSVFKKEAIVCEDITNKAVIEFITEYLCGRWRNGRMTAFDVLEIARFAHKYEITDLLDICNKNLANENYLGFDAVSEIMKFAELFEQKDLHTVCVDFVKSEKFCNKLQEFICNKPGIAFAILDDEFIKRNPKALDEIEKSEVKDEDEQLVDHKSTTKKRKKKT